MSQNPPRSRAFPEAHPRFSFTKDRGSDKQRSDELVGSDSKADSDSNRQRAERVGLRGGRYRSHSLAALLEARTIHHPNGCWLVTGHQLHSGHVQIQVGSHSQNNFARVRAHVFAWEQANGRSVPDGLVVMHACDQPNCVNPAHLSVGTQRDNVLDSIHKGRYNCFGRQKLDAAKVRQIRALAAKGELTYKQIGQLFGVGRSAISGVLTGATWSHVPDPLDQPVANVEPVATVEMPVYEFEHWLDVPPVTHKQAS